MSETLTFKLLSWSNKTLIVFLSAFRLIFIDFSNPLDSPHFLLKFAIFAQSFISSCPRVFFLWLFSISSKLFWTKFSTFSLSSSAASIIFPTILALACWYFLSTSLSSSFVSSKTTPPPLLRGSISPMYSISQLIIFVIVSFSKLTLYPLLFLIFSSNLFNMTILLIKG